MSRFWSLATALRAAALALATALVSLAAPSTAQAADTTPGVVCRHTPELHRVYRAPRCSEAVEVIPGDGRAMPPPLGDEPAMAAAQGPVTMAAYTVKQGDTLWAIAKAHYGDPLLYRAIYEANATLVSDPDLIFPGQVLTLPSAAAA